MMAPRRRGPVERLRVETERASAALPRAGGVGGTIADWLNGYAVALAGEIADLGTGANKPLKSMAGVIRLVERSAVESGALRCGGRERCRRRC